MSEISEALHALLAWVEGWADSPYGAEALFGLSFLESSIFPIPPDVLLIALCLGDPSRSMFFALLCSVASVVGGMAGYGIGYWGGRPLLNRMFAAERIAVVKRYYDRWNAWATGIAGLTPLPYKIFTIAGGTFGVSFKIFVVASILARSLRFFAVALLIQFYGEPIKTFIHEYLNLLFVAFVIILVGGYWLVAGGARRASKSEAGEA